MKLTEKDLALTVKEFAEKYAGKTFRSGRNAYSVSAYEEAKASESIAKAARAVVMSRSEHARMGEEDLKRYTGVILEPTHGVFLDPSWEYTEETEPVTPSKPENAEG